jgi:phage terminase large subunit-like protein
MATRKQLLNQSTQLIDTNKFTDLALQYCEDVLSGKILVSTQVKSACRRHLEDLAKIDSQPDYPYTYSVEQAERVCNFATRLPHVAGRWAIQKNNHFVIQPWQAFILTSLFGWVHKDTGYRRYGEALISVPRKNGKSFLASAICLYCLLCDHEPGAQVFAAANNLEQSMTVFRPAKQMVEKMNDLQTCFEIEANAKSLVIPDGSRFVPLVGVARDGQSAHCCVLDEYHEAKDDSLYLSLSQSMGARTQPLMLITTTAGVTIEGPCHIFQRDCEQMLEGTLERPELFAYIATIDKDTDWTTEQALIMANPNLGVSVNLQALKIEHQNAIRQVSKQNAFKTKKLNIWCNAASAWMNLQKWVDCADSSLTPEMFEGQPCFMACDLSTKLDITAIVKVFKVGSQFYCFPKFYLPSERALDPALGMYSHWVSQGALTATDGTQIDMEQVLEETLADIERYKPTEFIFDKWKAEMFTEFIGKRYPQLTLTQIPMEVRHISGPMKELEALIYSKGLKHNNNPVMNWMISNVVAKTDVKSNVYPRKARDENKIDGVVALILAIARATAPDTTTKASFSVFFV